MIRYNMRYRGSFEYDKFVLNIMQYNNLINYMISDINSNKNNSDNKMFSTLKETNDKINNLYKNSEELNESVYKKYIMIKK